MSRLTPEEMALITEAVTEAVLKATSNSKCGLCTSDKVEVVRHNRHHDLIDRLEKFLDRLDSFRWKTASGIIVTVVSAVLLAIFSIIWHSVKN